MLCHICLCCAVLSDHCSLVMAWLMALLFVISLCFVTFPSGVSGQVWALIVSIPVLLPFSLLICSRRLKQTTFSDIFCSRFKGSILKKKLNE